MSESTFDLEITENMNILNLSTIHVNGKLYFVKTDNNWVAEDDSIHIHSLVGFFSDLNKLDNTESKSLMNKWGISFRPDTINPNYNEGINE
tara:strand:+ start:95 stop:367 length:273 start_codon:yes stop_codon:yes gene_type:complete